MNVSRGVQRNIEHLDADYSALNYLPQVYVKLHVNNHTGEIPEKIYKPYYFNKSIYLMRNSCKCTHQLSIIRIINSLASRSRAEHMLL